MMRLCTLILISSFFIGLKAQEQSAFEELGAAPSKLVIFDFSYPIFLNGEQHSSFSAKYSFNSDFELALQGFYDTYLLSDRFRVEVLSKSYVTEKIHVFFGMESEFESSKYGQKQKRPRIGLIGGLGYKVNDNFLIEARGNFQINESPMGVYGEALIRMPQVYTFGNKIKF